MKPVITTLIALILTTKVFAQAPDKMSYQTVIRNSSNSLISSAPIGMRISVLQGSVTGSAIYIETQSPTTNANGLASMEIGGGTVVIGNFSAIDWANGPYFIKTETDPTGGTNYSITGTSQLLSVPFALYAKNTDSWSVNADSIFTFKKVGIGTSSPKLSLDVRTDNLSAIRGAGFSQYSSNNFGSILFLNKFRGSIQNPNPVINNDYTGGIILSGYNGTSASVSSTAIGSAIIGGRINGNVTLNSLPQDLYFATGATTTQNDPYLNNTVRMVITSSGNVGIGTTIPARILHVNDVMRLEPRASAPTSPSKGDIYFDSTTNKLRVYDGTTWQNCW